MRNFDSLLFLGNGKVSEDGVKKLHRIINEAVSISSGLQQGGPDVQSELALEEAVCDIVAALTGKEITLGSDLPYPGPFRLNYNEFVSYWDKDWWSCTVKRSESELTMGDDE